MSADIAENKEQGAAAIQPKKRIAMAVFIIAVATVFLIGTLILIIWGYQRTYSDKIYPGVYLGTYHLGGMSADEVRKFIDDLNIRLDQEGVNYIFDQDGQEQKIKVETVMVASEAAIELVYFDADEFIAKALEVGRGSNWFYNALIPWRYRWFPQRINLPVKMDRKNFTDVLNSQLSKYEVQPQNAAVNISSISPLSFKVIDEVSGSIFDLELIISETVEKIGMLNFEPIRIEKHAVQPGILSKELAEFSKQIELAIKGGEIKMVYPDAGPNDKDLWRIKPAQFFGWIQPKKLDNQIYALLDFDQVDKYLENVAAEIDKLAEESKFVMEDGKVKEFRSGQVGRVLDRQKTFESLESIFVERNKGNAEATTTCYISVQTAEPQIKLSDINNFGISEIIGVGESTFRDSHTNRIKNITHAVERLNGTIIFPGEVFSSIKYAGPFTSENGYLPEEVIKGTQIKKEIGGGMCQIGTTLFRMAMNSGMPIVERTNHSLVVGYYADPVNGNPGTDATLYEPILDFKFLNDTGSYLLLETNIDFKKQKLTFTLWGKSDGRRGFYTHPVVSRWIPAGEPQERISDTLGPGETKCQNAFRGAVASFTYTRFTSTSERIDRVFESYYRPLPKICMVGAGTVTSTASGDGSASTTPPVASTTTP